MRFNLARLSIEKPLLAWLIILFCLLGGIWAFLTIGRLEDPAFTIKNAVIVTQYPGATAEEVEQEVTEPLEIALQQMDQLKRMESESAPGRSEIQVEMLDQYRDDELEQVWDDLRKRMRDASAFLPPGASEPFVIDDFGDVYGIFYAITAPGYSDAQKRDLAKMLRRELSLVDGVARVETAGLEDERIYVEIPQARLARLNLPFPAVLQAISNENEVVSAGEAPMGERLLRISVPQSIDGVAALENLLIAPANSGDTIRLGDIATVTRAHVERPDQFIYHNNQRAFTVAVAGLPSANIVDVGHAVEAKLDQLAPRIPVGVDIHPIYEQHQVVQESLNGFLVNLALSLAIVVGMLCVFMGWRAGLSVGTVLLLTISGTIFFMKLGGLEMQRISLGALIIAMGMLVDNAIVVVEGIQTGVQRGEGRKEAAEDAVSATQWPLLGATVIGIMAFSGIGLSPDVTGEFLFSLFAVILISLMLSWVLAITVAPLVSYTLFKSNRGNPTDPYGGRVFGLYRRILGTTLRARWITLAVLLVVTVTSYWAFGFVKQSFFPNSNTPIFYVDVVQPQGADILDVNEDLQEMGAYVAELENVLAVDTFVGAGATRFMLTYAPEQPNTAYGQLIVRTADRNEIPPLANQIEKHLEENWPGAEIRVNRIVFGPPSGADLEARFSGPDADVLRALADKAMESVEREANVTEVRTTWRNRAPVIIPEINESRARTLGVAREDIAQAVSFATTGETVGLYREKDRLIPIVARAPVAERNEADALADRLIWSPGRNSYVSMDDLVSAFEVEAEETLIQRYNRVRTITVQAQSRQSETAATAFERFHPAIESVELPPGYTLEWGGEFEASMEANESLGAQLPVSFIVMLLVSLLLFLKVRQPLIVWLIVPMSLVGVVIGLLTTNTAFSFTALLGFLSLSGMLIKNAIVLIDEIDVRIDRGDDRWEALRDGSVSRLRPVLLAAGTTILGMTPLLTDAFFRGMAVTIIGGLAFATVLTMVAAPLLYSLFFGIKPPNRRQSQADAGSVSAPAAR